MDPRPDKTFAYWIAIQGALLTIFVWCILFSAAFAQGDVVWPKTEGGWENVITLIVASSFLMVKSWGMARRFETVDSLAISIIATNLSFAFAYLILTGATLYPGEFVGPVWMRVIRAPVIVTSLWGIYEVCMVPDKSKNYVEWLKDKVRSQELDIRALKLLLLTYETRQASADPAIKEEVAS